MKILIADDDSITRRLLETILTKWGYQVIIAQDGDEAWQILQGDGAPQARHPRLDDAGPGRRGDLPPRPAAH